MKVCIEFENEIVKFTISKLHLIAVLLFAIQYCYERLTVIGKM